MPSPQENFWLAFKLHRVRRCLSHPTLLESPHAALHFYILQSFSFLSHTVDFPNLSQTDSLPSPTGPLAKIRTMFVSCKSFLATQPFALIFTHPRRVLSEVVVDAAALRLRVVLVVLSRFACARREILLPICRATLKNAQKDSEWK